MLSRQMLAKESDRDKSFQSQAAAQGSAGWTSRGETNIEMIPSGTKPLPREPDSRSQYRKPKTNINFAMRILIPEEQMTEQWLGGDMLLYTSSR